MQRGTHTELESSSYTDKDPAAQEACHCHSFTVAEPAKEATLATTALDRAGLWVWVSREEDEA